MMVRLKSESAWTMDVSVRLRPCVVDVNRENKSRVWFPI